MSDEKPRIFQNTRDALWSIIAVAVVMFVAVAFTGMCSFGNKGAENVPVQQVDAKTFLEIEARGASYPVRYPAGMEAEGWQPNSARRMNLGGEPGSAVGWVQGRDAYVQVVQTGVSAEDALTNYDNQYREHQQDYTVADHTVSLYTSKDRDVRDLRIIDLEDVRILVSGATTAEQFDAVISEIVQSEPLATQG